MTDRQIGVTLTADAADLQRGFSAGSASAAQFGSSVVAALSQADVAGARFVTGAGGVVRSVNGISVAERAHDAAAERFIQTLERKVNALGKTESELLKMQATELGVAGRASPLISKLTAQDAALAAGSARFNQYGISAAQTAAAMRGVPAQITDIVVSLQGGQAPLTVLLQQGGQLKDMFGGLVPAGKALGGTLLKLINPYTAVAAAVAVLTLAYSQGASESQRYANGLAMTGGYAGLSAGQLQDAARTISGTVGTQRQAADVLARLVETGQVGGSGLEGMARATVTASRDMGKAVKDTVGEFSKLSQDPVKGIEELNGKYHFLTLAVYEQIQALEQQGRKDEAAALAQQTYASALESMAAKVKGNLGSIESTWQSLGRTASEAWDAMLNVGRTKTFSETLGDVGKEILRVKADIARATEGADENGLFLNAAGAVVGRVDQVRLRRRQEELAALQAKQGALAEDQQLVDAAAQGERDRALAVQAGIEWEKQRLELRSKEKKLEDDIAATRERGRKAGKSNAEIEVQVAALRAKNADKPASHTRIDKADLAYDVSQIQASYAAMTSAAANAERILDANRSAVLISEKDYYAAKRAFIDSNAKLQIEALLKENARIETQKATGADQINNQRKVAENKAKMAEIQAKASADIQVSTIQETSANTRLTQSYLQAKQAAEDYLATSSARYNRELDGLGRGNVWRDQNSAQNQINDRYQAERISLAADLRRNQITQAQYTQYLSIVDDSNKQALALDANYWRDKLALQGNWQIGAKDALANYTDQARNYAEQAGGAFTNAFKGAEDAAIKFARTGKVSVADLADTVINEFLRIQARTAIAQGGNALMGALASLAPSMFGSFSSNWSSTNTSNPNSLASMNLLHVNAKGGVYDSPGLSAFSSQIVSRPTQFAFAKGTGLMGEAGPEAIIPLKRGTDGSLGVRAIGGGGNGVVKVEVINNGQPVSATATSSQQADGGQLIRIVLDAVGESIADGVGSVPRALEGRYGLQRTMG